MRRRVKPGTIPVIDRCGITGKVRHASAGAALAALKQRQREAREQLGHHSQRRRERRAFRCWLCHGWHLSSQPWAST